MTRAHKTLLFTLAAAVGLWGCAQGTPGPGTASLGRIRTLEHRVNQQEEEYRSATAARDQARKKLAAAEDERGRLQHDVARLRKQLEQAQGAFSRERDELRQQLQLRTAERDGLQGQFNDFRKGVRSLLHQADAAGVDRPSPPVTAVSAGAAPSTL
jgi:uncharacterized coiled-coil DUF342 family protein